jgi:ribonuclease HI
MNVTIYSDASFDPKTKKGSWAFSLVCDRYRFAQHGKIPNNRIYSSIHYCEMYALCKGVTKALQVEGVHTITARTDSDTVIRFFYGFPPSCRDNLLSLSQSLIKEVKAKNVRLTIGHVKSHQKENTKEAYMNNSVDRLAKNALKK